MLAPQTPSGLIGSIAPDMIRGPLPKGLDADILLAAREHQRIDRFTDSHPVFARTRSRLVGLTDPRLTGVLADVLYDYVLARGWSQYRDDPFKPYVANAEQSLLDQVEQVPADMQWRVRLMVAEQWLASYATAAGIRARLVTMSGRISSRLGRNMDLAPPLQAIESLYPALAEDFALFWPGLQAFVTDQRRTQQARPAPATHR